MQGDVRLILATVDGYPRSGPPDPAFASIPAYDPIIVIKALYFGKKILRMAGIVQMLHGHKPPYDNYYYHANRKRKRLV